MKAVRVVECVDATQMPWKYDLYPPITVTFQAHAFISLSQWIWIMHLKCYVENVWKRYDVDFVFVFFLFCFFFSFLISCFIRLIFHLSQRLLSQPLNGGHLFYESDFTSIIIIFRVPWKTLGEERYRPSQPIRFHRQNISNIYKNTIETSSQSHQL